MGGVIAENIERSRTEQEMLSIDYGQSDPSRS
jgi:hypothetical protein